MQFKDIKQNYTVYLLDRNKLESKEGKVVSAGAPYFQTSTNVGATQPLTRVMDITVEADGVTKTYVVNETDAIAYAPGYVLSTDKHGLLGEVKAIMKISQDAIDRMDTHKDTVSKCQKLLYDLDDVEREKQKTENRLSKLEDGIEKILRAINNRSGNS